MPQNQMIQPFGLPLIHQMTRKHQFIGRAKTVLVKDNDVEQAFRVLNRYMGKEDLLGIIRRTLRYEVPTNQRNRMAFERCQAIYNEDMERKIRILSRKNRKDHSPGFY